MEKIKSSSGGTNAIESFYLSLINEVEPLLAEDLSRGDMLEILASRDKTRNLLCQSKKPTAKDLANTIEKMTEEYYGVIVSELLVNIAGAKE